MKIVTWFIQWNGWLILVSLLGGAILPWIARVPTMNSLDGYLEFVVTFTITVGMFCGLIAFLIRALIIRRGSRVNEDYSMQDAVRDLGEGKWSGSHQSVYAFVGLTMGATLLVTFSAGLFFSMLLT